MLILLAAGTKPLCSHVVKPSRWLIYQLVILWDQTWFLWGNKPKEVLREREVQKLKSSCFFLYALQTPRFSALYCNIGLIYMETHDGNIRLHPAPGGRYW